MRLINHLSHVNYVIPSLPKDIDMKLHVVGIKAAVGGKLPLFLFGNVFVREYLAQLNPKHHPPYCLECICIIECMIDYVKLELGFIMEEHRLELLKWISVWYHQLLDGFSPQAAVWLLCGRYDCREV